MEYQWREGARTRGLKIDAVAPVLARIERKKGMVTPQAVLQEAKKPASPIHSWFQWDETEAAHQYRLLQAGELIRAVTVKVIPGEERSVRAYVHLGDPKTYESVVTVMGDEDKRSILLGRALRELEVFRAKYDTLTELAAVFAAMDEVAA